MKAKSNHRRQKCKYSLSGFIIDWVNKLKLSSTFINLATHFFVCTSLMWSNCSLTILQQHTRFPINVYVTCSSKHKYNKHIPCPGLINKSCYNCWHFFILFLSFRVIAHAHVVHLQSVIIIFSPDFSVVTYYCIIL